MNWFCWLLVVLLALGAIGKIALMDKPREPITRLEAIVSVILNGLLIAGLVYYVRPR